MATITFTRTSVCAGGDHVRMDASFNGGASRSFTFDVDELRAPINGVSLEDQEAFLKLWLRIHIAGKTRAQISTEFANPVTGTI